MDFRPTLPRFAFVGCALDHDEDGNLDAEL